MVGRHHHDLTSCEISCAHLALATESARARSSSRAPSITCQTNSRFWREISRCNSRHDGVSFYWGGESVALLVRFNKAGIKWATHDALANFWYFSETLIWKFDQSRSHWATEQQGEEWNCKITMNWSFDLIEFSRSLYFLICASFIVIYSIFFSAILLPPSNDIIFIVYRLYRDLSAAFQIHFVLARLAARGWRREYKIKNRRVIASLAQREKEVSANSQFRRLFFASWSWVGKQLQKWQTKGELSISHCRANLMVSFHRCYFFFNLFSLFAHLYVSLNCESESVSAWPFLFFYFSGPVNLILRGVARFIDQLKLRSSSIFNDRSELRAQKTHSLKCLFALEIN